MTTQDARKAESSQLYLINTFSPGTVADSCKYLTCGSALKTDYKMHCGFLLYFSDTILNLPSLYIKSIFFLIDMLANSM